MKFRLLLFTLLLSAGFSGFCTTWTIGFSGNTFTPSSITITFGDTVNFALNSTHNAVEVSQTTWIANGTTPLAGGFQVPLGGGSVFPAQLGVGTHYYVCTPHASLGMKGTITVQACNPPATPGSISGSTVLCDQNAVTYSVTPVTGATSYTWNLPSGWSGSSTSNSIVATPGSAGGNITVTADNTCGSSNQQTKTVAITIIDTSVSLSGTTLTANTSGAAYQWINCTGNTPISGATSQSFQPTATGNYAVILTVGNCIDTSSCHFINVVGLDEINTPVVVSVYPNPANDLITINTSEKAINTTLTITDAAGKKVLSGTISKGTTAIDISLLTPGLYLIYTDDQSAKPFKLIKK